MRKKQQITREEKASTMDQHRDRDSKEKKWEMEADQFLFEKLPITVVLFPVSLALSILFPLKEDKEKSKHFSFIIVNRKDFQAISQ